MKQQTLVDTLQTIKEQLEADGTLSAEELREAGLLALDIAYMCQDKCVALHQLNVEVKKIEEL